MGKGKHRICLGIVLGLLCWLMAFTAMAATDMSYEDYVQLAGVYAVDSTIPEYRDYLGEADGIRPEKEIILDASQPDRYEENGETVEPKVLENWDGMTGAALLTGETGLAEYTFTVEEAGTYELGLTYYPYGGKASEIQRAFFLDGKLPYRELAMTELSRVWRNGNADMQGLTEDENGVQVRTWKKDNQGNDMKPAAEEAPMWLSESITDANGYITTPLSVFLTAGEHTLTILSLREPVLLKEIVFANTGANRPYAERVIEWENAGIRDTSGISIRLEAENATRTSSQMLYPIQDQSSPAVYPSSSRYLLNNSIGGNSWRHAGQWIEWDFEAPEDGLYCLSVYGQQNFVRGIDVSRKIMIDGQVPFTEWEAERFSYAQSWKMETPGNADGAYRFPLSAGKHTLRMEVVLGDMADIIRNVQGCVEDLNHIYREVLYLIGVSPDQYRDYQIERSLPGLKAELEEVDARLAESINTLQEVAGNNSDKLTVLRTMHDQLRELIADQERFTEVISSYKVNVRACGNWITQVLGQPLQIDRLYIHSADVKPTAVNDSWLNRAGFEMSRLGNSFVIDYNRVGNVAGAEENPDTPVLTLWIGTGRDQANVIKNLIDEHFTPESGINVNVQLVDMNTLLRATLSGEGPDVAIQVANTNGIAGAVLNTGNDTPVNYGLRNAILDLRRFDDFDQVAERFAESALVPFSFGDACWALPDTMTFPMMFYRKDILAEIGMELPKTWDEVKVAMSVLAKNQMEFGMLPGEQIFAMLLFQAGGQYYTENGDASALDSDTAINVFRRYCEYYTDYKLDAGTSVEERFRTGECPIIISDYTTYNNLQVSAPDIEGLWGFTNVPGTLTETGEISIATGSSGLADIIMAQTKYPDECWEFLKWWTDASTQTLYGREMESLMGESARVPTANLEALGNLSWPAADYTVLMKQLNAVHGIPQVPGGYYTWRNVNNAFYTVTTPAASRVDGKADTTPREELMDKIYYINAEIDYKRTEFGLPVRNAGEEE